MTAPSQEAQEREMVKQYRKKPVEIEAFQLTEELAVASLVDGIALPFGLRHSAADWHAGRRTCSRFDVPIKTLEGTMRARLGDWIIKGVNGELYPCKPDIFAATYEPVRHHASPAQPVKMTEEEQKLVDGLRELSKYGCWTTHEERLVAIIDRISAAPETGGIDREKLAELIEATRHVLAGNVVNSEPTRANLKRLRNAYDAIIAALPTLRAETGWQDIASAPYDKNVLAWLYLPKNPIASGPVIGSRCYVEADEPDTYGTMRRTVGCWWVNGMYYAAGHVTHWMPLPAPPAPTLRAPTTDNKEGE